MQQHCNFLLWVPLQNSSEAPFKTWKTTYSRWVSIISAMCSTSGSEGDMSMSGQVSLLGTIKSPDTCASPKVIFIQCYLSRDTLIISCPLAILDRKLSGLFPSNSLSLLDRRVFINAGVHSTRLVFHFFSPSTLSHAIYIGIFLIEHLDHSAGFSAKENELRSTLLFDSKPKLDQSDLPYTSQCFLFIIASPVPHSGMASSSIMCAWKLLR